PPPPRTLLFPYTTLFRSAGSLLATLVVLAFAARAVAAPSGPPIRIGGTLALTGPLAPTALLHKIAGEVYVEELNKGNGLLGRPRSEEHTSELQSRENLVC